MTQEERIARTNTLIGLQNQISKLKKELEGMWEHVRALEQWGTHKVSKELNTYAKETGNTQLNTFNKNCY